MSGGFQTQVYGVPAQGVAGDLASANPLFSYDAGPGGLVAGTAGLVIGRFAWTYPPLDPNSAAQIATNSGAGPVAGFVMRAKGLALNTVFLSDAGMTILSGMPASSVMTGGDFWVVNVGSTEAIPGQKAFANLLTGAVSFATAGTFPSSASDSGGAVVNTTLTLVGGVAGNVLTVASVSVGTIYPGAVLNSNAVGQVSPFGSGGTTGTGGAGTYELSIGEQTVAAGTTIGGNYGVYTVGTTSQVFAVGMQLSGGTTLPANTVLTYLISGTGNNSSTFATNSGTAAQTSHAVVGSTVVETKWIAVSGGLTNELVKMSSWPLG
jgi:hypothetical protein